MMDKENLISSYENKVSRPLKFSELCLILTRYQIMLEEEPNRYTIEEFIQQEDFRRGMFLKKDKEFYMKLEVFKEIIRLLKEQELMVDNAYKAGIDLVNFFDSISTAVGHLIGSIYGKEGKETFDWWCYDKNWGQRDDITFTDKDGIELCRTIEKLHQYLEENKTDDYELPRYMTKEETEETIKKLFL